MLAKLRQTAADRSQPAKKSGWAGRSTTGALGGTGGWGAGGALRLERGPTARYLLQKQPYEVLMRAAGLTTLPHVSRRHQPLARREALAVHFGGGDRSKRTLDSPRTHY